MKLNKKTLYKVKMGRGKDSYILGKLKNRNGEGATFTVLKNNSGFPWMDFEAFCWSNHIDRDVSRFNLENK